MLGVVYVLMAGLAGFMMFVGARFDPILQSYYIDIMGVFICWLAPFMVMMGRLKKGEAMIYFNPPIRNKPTFEFLYRVGERRVLSGTRLPGTGFSNIEGLGLVGEIGGKSAFKHGDKVVQQVLQDIAHTPDPRYHNFTYWLYKWGYTNFDQVIDTLNGSDPDIMKKIWNNMLDHPQVNLTDKLVESIKDMSPSNIKIYNEAMAGTVNKDKSILSKEGIAKDFEKDSKRMHNAVDKITNKFRKGE